MHAEKLQTLVPVLDENGLLIDANAWDESTAVWLAQDSGIQRLEQDHWRIIYALRDYYFKYRAAPAMRRLCRKQGVETDCIQRLFCTCLTAWRVAGLPDPGEEAKTYLGTR